MSGELKDCPFCGGEATIIKTGNDATKSRSLTIRCPKCRVERTVKAIRHGFGWLEKVSVEAWNTRPVEDELAAKVKELEAELEKHRWIPVTERMPKNMVRVLIRMANNYVVCACYSLLRDEWKNDSGSVIRTENVVSWKPLPEPPEVEG